MSNLYIITGPSSSGKTSMINQLQNMGYMTMKETARDVLPEISDTRIRQNAMIYQQLIMERKARNVLHNVIADRGLPDYLVFADHFNVKIDRMLYEKAFQEGRNYHTVFYLKQLPNFVQDGIRVEPNKLVSNDVGKRILEEYRRKGCNVVEVEPDSLEERIKFIQPFLPKRL